jgi:hypothetical protein
VANQISMSQKQSIAALHAQGVSNRQIARLLSLDRDTVNRHVRLLKPHNQPGAPAGKIRQLELFDKVRRLSFALWEDRLRSLREEIVTVQGRPQAPNDSQQLLREKMAITYDKPSAIAIRPAGILIEAPLKLRSNALCSISRASAGQSRPTDWLWELRDPSPRPDRPG